jgi:hypothetical protein
MASAGEDVLEALRVLGKAGTNPIAQVLAHQGTFLEMDHYPKGDVYDAETASQYYYHAHRPEAGEHGHFHTFIRAKGIPADVKPAPFRGTGKRPRGKHAICHLIGISMDRTGLPIARFTTNQWVTGETLYGAQDTIRLLDQFGIDHVQPCLATNRWISAMLRLFRPQIEMLLLQRDRVLAKWQRAHADVAVLDDEDLDITSSMPIDIDRQIARVARAQASRSAVRSFRARKRERSWR